jgi:Homeodomain-like domain
MLVSARGSMSKKKWQVVLAAVERSALVALTKRGRADARQIRRAHNLLQAAEGRSDEAIAAALHTNRSTMERTRHRFVAARSQPQAA